MKTNLCCGTDSAAANLYMFTNSLSLLYFCVCYWTGQKELKPSKLTATGECSGELRLTVGLPKSVASHVEKRDTNDESLSHVFEASYELASEKKTESQSFDVQPTKVKGQFEGLLR